MNRNFCDRCGKEIHGQDFGSQYVSKPYVIYRQRPVSFSVTASVTAVAPPFMPDEVDLCSKCMGDFAEFMKGETEEEPKK